MRISNATQSKYPDDSNIIAENLFNHINYNYLEKVAWKNLVEQADDMKQSLIDFLNFIWSEAIGSLEEVLELSDEENGRKVLKITNQQVRII